MKEAESGAPLQLGATQPEHDGVSHETGRIISDCEIVYEPQPTFTHSELTTRLERMARLVVQEAAKVMCQYCAAGNGHLVGRSGFYVCKAAKLYDQLTTEKLQQLREAVERT